MIDAQHSLHHKGDTFFFFLPAEDPAAVQATYSVRAEVVLNLRTR